MKIHELAKEFDTKAHEFLKRLTELGFVYSSHTKELTDTEADNIRSVIAKADKAATPEEIKIKELSLMPMIGIYFDMKTGKYYISTLRLYPEEHDKYGVQLSKPYSSVDHLAIDLNRLCVDSGFYSPTELQKIYRKRLTTEQK